MNQLRVRIAFGFLAALFSLFADLNTFAQINNPPNYPPYFFPSALFPASRPLNDVTYGNGTFVAIGNLGTILTSKDGIHWTNHSSDFSTVSNNCANINFSTETYSAGGDRITFLYVKRAETDADLETNRHSLVNYYYNRSPGAFMSVAFGRGIFVIIGAYGQSLTSRDGEHWTASELPRIPGKTTYLHSMTVGDSGFVAVGQHGMIFTSPDGLEWTQEESGTDAILLSVAYGNGTYVALADINSSYTLAITSKDGIKWTPADNRFGRIESIAFGNGIFVGTMTFNNFPPQLVGEALGKWKFGSTVVSKDGINWSQVTAPLPAEGTGPFGAYFPTHLTFSGGRFIATSFGDISTSMDANMWTPSANLKSVFYGATYGNGTFVAVGNGTIIAATNNVSPSSMTIVNSKDAVNWNDSKAPPSRLIWGYFTNDTVFKLGYNFNLTSTNEASYTKKLLGTGDLIKYHFFSKGYDGNIETTNEYSILESSDGETWTTRDKAAITGIVNGNRVIPYTDSPPTVLASEDGIHWHRIKPIHYDNPTPLATTGITQVTPTSDNGVVINLNGQGYKLNLTSNIGQVMEIQASTNLESWETLTTITNTGAVLNFVDPDAKNYPQRFYRLKIQ